MSGSPGQRIDKWLWHARFFKSRSLAATIAGGGRVRVNGDAIAKASFIVRAGDVLTFAQGTRVRVVKLLALAERRGPASEAALLYEDLSPPPIRRDDTAPGANPAPSARPSKRDRRAIARLRAGDGNGDGKGS